MEFNQIEANELEVALVWVSGPLEDLRLILVGGGNAVVEFV
jgi:hypothetical protein